MRDDRQRLLDILGAIENIERFLKAQLTAILAEM